MNPAMMNPMMASMLGQSGLFGGNDKDTENLFDKNKDDLDGDGKADHLMETKHRIDDYLAKQYKLGKRKLSVSVNYGNMPLEYQYLQQYHGFKNPLAGTPLGPSFGLAGPKPGSPYYGAPRRPMFSPFPSSWQQGSSGYGAGMPPPPPSGYGPIPLSGYGQTPPAYG